MAARFTPLVALLCLLMPAPWCVAGNESALALEPTQGTGPFHAGDQLQLDADAAAESEAKLVTVLQTGCWPWVLVRYERAPRPFEMWVNFAQVLSARRMASR